jgi:hypothetical protein
MRAGMSARDISGGRPAAFRLSRGLLFEASPRIN